jgi:signal transduction histidine kinase
LKNFGIKLKLIIIFIVIKLIPLFILLYIIFIGINEVKDYYNNNTKTIFKNNKKLLKTTTNNAINDSIVALDKISQESLEKQSVLLAQNIADFLYERDKDILFLSRIFLKNNEQQILNSFFQIKRKEILVHDDYLYDNNKHQWYPENLLTKKDTKIEQSSVVLRDNKKEFNKVKSRTFKTKNIPIYKEIVFLNLNGKEMYKKSNIEAYKFDISKKENTYLKAEDYWLKIQNLKEGEIYVSDVIGEYVPSKIIGHFTKEKAKKSGVKFEPKNYAYAGKENPNGKKFEGIIRFVTPVFRNFKKVGYLSFALDHRHIMEFTDTYNPVGEFMKQDIADASTGNYAFMWDWQARNISHPRDYFISGFDAKTGKRIPGWISKNLAEEFAKSKKTDLSDFLSDYPKYHNQSLNEKPNLKQLKNEGSIALDCRYLNFAPQCKGWNDITTTSNYGSFIIYWSEVWKLTTAAVIPYYTGQYKSSNTGFGFVTIGANVDEFHKAANNSKKKLDKTLDIQNKQMDKVLHSNNLKLSNFITMLLNELTFMTIIMVIVIVIIAIFISNYITSKIKNLILGIRQFSKNDFDYKINVTSKDEIGELENSFNLMAQKIKHSIEENKLKDLQLIQKSKMADMGDMMSSIIHQWKQPLNVISLESSSAVLSSSLGLSDEKEMLKKFNSIEKQTKIMSQTMDDFGNFFKPTELKKYSVYSVCNDAYKILHAIYSNKNIIINIHNINDSMVYGYPNELIQVLINILNNSRDAILHSNCEIKEIDLDILSDEKNVIIIIKDYAGGIDEKIKNNIFQAYFTTKGNNGTGIGLDICKNIITKAKGTIVFNNVSTIVNDKQYIGAQFTITLRKIDD